MSVTADDFLAECEALAERLGADWTEPLGHVAEILHAGIQQNFIDQRGGTGVQWPARKDNKPHSLLVETGALEQAATGRHAASVNRIVDGSELQIGVDKSVDDGGIMGAAVHNFGYPPRNIPKREYLVVHGGIIDDAVEIIADDAVRQLGW